MNGTAGYAKDNSQFYINDSDRHIVIKNEINLDGDTICLPENSILDFQGGSLKNGVLIGNNTHIRAECRTIFHNVVVSGTWLTPIIYAVWFNNVRNAIREPFKMLNCKIQNRLIIGEGIWELEMPVDEKYAINIPSNSEIEFHGTIRNYSDMPGGFSIFHISGSKNVKICGDGEIIGNRDDKSVAKRGSQTGHTITIGNSSNIVVEGLTLSYSRGDGILIGETDNFNMPENVIIKNMRILHSRRQGISICAGHNITIENVYIEDVSGAPQGPCAGVDIENYDKGGVICNVSLRNVMVTNVSKGLSIYNDSDVTYDEKKQSLSGRAELSRIHVSNYIATDCEIGLRIGYLTENIQIENSTFEATDVALSLYSDYSQGHDYYHQFCHQINNCKFLSKKSDLKASVDIRTKGFVFNNCTFETYSPFTVHASATNTIFRDCYFLSHKMTRFIGVSSLSGCNITTPSLIFYEGSKAVDCTINSIVTLHGNNTIWNCEVFYQGKFTNLITVRGKSNIIGNNRLNVYDNNLDVGKETNMSNVIFQEGKDNIIKNNVIGLKNCKVAFSVNSQDSLEISQNNLFVKSIPYSYKDKDGKSFIIDYKNGVATSE